MGVRGRHPVTRRSRRDEERAKGRQRKRDEGRSEKSSAAYVGFRERLAVTAAATAAVAAALIRVRRYEIIKLGLDGGEGDSVAPEGV